MEWLRSADFVLTLLMLLMLFCVLDAGVHMPKLIRPIQLAIAAFLMAFGGCECKSHGLEHAPLVFFRLFVVTSTESAMRFPGTSSLI